MNISINKVINPETITKADLLALKDDPTIDWCAEAAETVSSDFVLTYDSALSDNDERRYACSVDGFYLEVMFSENSARVLQVTASVDSEEGNFGFGSC